MNSINMNFEEIFKVIDDFVNFCDETTEFWHDDRAPDEHVVMEKLEQCKSKQYVDILTKHKIISLWYKYCDHFLTDNYEYKKRNLIMELVNDRASMYKITRRDPHVLIYDMSFYFREITKLVMRRHIYNTYCKEEIEKTKKRYALNVLMYKTRLPQELVFYEVSKY